MIRNLSILTNFSNNESFSDNCRDKFCNLSFKLESSSSFLLSTCWEPVINKHKSMKIDRLGLCLLLFVLILYIPVNNFPGMSG